MFGAAPPVHPPPAGSPWFGHNRKRERDDNATRQDDAIRRANAEGLQRLLVGMRRRDEGEPCPEPQRPRGMYPWWEVDEQQQPQTDGSGVFHLRTRRHDGSVGLLVDPGAHANLSGSCTLDHMAHEVNSKLKKSLMTNPLPVEGVGKKSQIANQSARVEMAVVDHNGEPVDASYCAPLIADSQLPPLLGNKTLRRLRTLLDLGDGRMIVPGPGGVELHLSPGSRVFALELTDSGHYVLPLTKRSSTKSDQDSHDRLDFMMGVRRNKSSSPARSSAERKSHQWDSSHDIPDAGTGQGVSNQINSSIPDCNVEVPHMKPVKSSRADGLAWVIADKAGLRQRLLQELGFATIHFHHDLHSRTQCQNMINELTLQSPWLLWIRFAGPCAGSGNRLDAVRAEHLCRIIRCQQQCSRALIVEANERSQVWNLQAVRECMNSLTLTIHQMCNYEVSLGSTQSPCCSRIRVLTNFPLQNRGTCECGNSVEHVHQRDLGNSGHRRFAAALKGLMNMIVRQASAVFQHTGQAPGNPQPEFIHDKTKTVRFSSLHVRDNLIDDEPEVTHVHQAQLNDSRLDLKQTAGNRPVIQMKLDQVTCSGTEDDYWLQGSENSIIRVHTTPRLSLFVPSPSDCPFPLNKLSEQRKTHVRWTQHSSIDAPEEHLYVDNWKEPSVSLKDRWTGATVFTVMVDSRVMFPAP